MPCKGSTWEQHGWTKCPPVCNRVPVGGRGSNQDSDDLPDLELPLPVRSGVLEGETRRGEPPGERVGVGGGDGLRVDMPLVPDAKRQVLGSTRAGAGVPNPDRTSVLDAHATQMHQPAPTLTQHGARAGEGLVRTRARKELDKSDLGGMVPIPQQAEAAHRA